MIGKTNAIVQVKTREAEFLSSIVPTIWVDSTSNIEYFATNNYGKWEIKASGTYNNTNTADKAFDDSEDTLWESETLDSHSATATLELICPLLIKPRKIFLKYTNGGNSTNASKLLGYNVETAQWEELHTLAGNNSTKTETIDISSDNFYSAFRLLCYRYSSFARPKIHDFKITEGVYKKF